MTITDSFPVKRSNRLVSRVFKASNPLAPNSLVWPMSVAASRREYWFPGSILLQGLVRRSPASLAPKGKKYSHNDWNLSTTTESDSRGDFSGLWTTVRRPAHIFPLVLYWYFEWSAVTTALTGH